MKKLVFGINITLVVFVAFAFKKEIGNKSARVKANGYATTFKHTTLNGFSETTAKAMICHFNMIKSYDKHPLPTSIWFDITTVHNIVKLLDDEKNYATNHQPSSTADKRVGIPDGIRIYFACDKSANTFPLKTSILLVSTKDNGSSSNPTCWSKRLHIDYYEHTVDDGLLKDGSICHDKDKCPGNKLYKICIPCGDSKTCTIPGPNNIKKIVARWMVKGFKNHPINTASVWFNLGLFEGIDRMTPKMSGMRIYFATHLITDKLSSRDAMVVTPTIYNEKTKTDDDYFDCSATKSYWQDYYKLYHTYLYSSAAMDNAELCPDNCN